MARGGKREPGVDPATGKQKKMGRPKAERPTNANVATRVLAQAKAEKLWLGLIELEKQRLGLGDNGELIKTIVSPGGVISGPDYQGRFSIIPLTNLLRYLEDRAYGRPVDTVNHLHDKPIEVNATVSIRGTLEKALQRALKR